MSRIRFMAPYLKGGQNAAQLANRIRYFATRPGVEKLPDERGDLPATKNQQRFIRRLLRDFPGADELLEYDEYLAAPTLKNASAFIQQVREDYMEAMSRQENYLDYIAHRPGVQRDGEHGLWGAGGKVQDLAQAAKEVADHTGNVWTPVVAIRREDAERLGYDDAKNWRALVNSCLCDIARGYKIHPDHLRWYAAFHQKEKSVHIHMVVFSTDPKEGFLTREGIRQIKSAFAKRIFRQEMLHVYEQKARQRDTLQREAARTMEDLIRQMRTGAVEDPRLEQLMADLAGRLKNTGGKKVYGYLPPRTKAVVDEIVERLAKDERVAAAYDLWNQMREEACRIYGENVPERVPLSQQKDFKPVRNMVVREALRLSQERQSGEDHTEQAASEPEALQERSALTAEPEQNDDALNDSKRQTEGDAGDWWSERYQAARQFLFGSEETLPDHAQAFELLKQEAGSGNALAMCDLGRMYADGLAPDDEDQEVAQAWYAQGLRAFLAAEEKGPGRYVEYRIGKLYSAGLGTEQDHAKAADWFARSAAQGYQYAQYALAGLYHRGQGVPQDYREAYRLYAAAAKKGFPYAHFELGKLLRDGLGCRQDTKQAAEHFKSAFLGFRGLEQRSHDDKLQYRIGWMLLQGVGTGKDEAAARGWFEKAARLGNLHAKYQLAKLTLTDPSAGPEQLREAVEFLREAAEKDHGGAQYALGKLYRDGVVVEQDLAEAVRWFRLSAKAGSEYAQYALGKLLLEQGETAEALRWLERSAGQGNSFAQYRLGMVYLRGEAVEKRVAEAVRYLTASAEGGNQFAQYALGKLYLLGQDVPRDREQAMKWLTRSAEQGNVYAQFFLDHPDCLRNPPLVLTVSRMFYHLGRIFEDACKADALYHGLQIDRKRRRQLNAKKMAMGHKADDHEDSGMTMR